MQYRTFPLPALPAPPHLQKHRQGSRPELSRRHTRRWEVQRQDLSSPSLETALGGAARRRGVSETARAQVAFAKHLINRPGIVPTSHTVFEPASLHWSLEQDGSCNYCLAILPRTLLSRPGRCPSLRATQHSTSPLAPPSSTLAVRVTPPTEI